MKILIAIITFFACLITMGSGADEQPKHEMNVLAVMDLKCGAGIAKDQCIALTDILIDEMVKMKKYTVIDRANRDKIISEAGFQQTACVEQSCTIELGRILRVGKMAQGTITKLEDAYIVNLQIVNVETGAVESFARETCEKCKMDNLITLISSAARKLLGETLEPTPVPPSEISPPSASGAKKIVKNDNDNRKILSSGICPAPQEGKAMIIFYRTFNGGFIYYSVFENGQKISQCKRGTYFYYEVNPGSHTFGTSGHLREGEGRVSVETPAGAIIFIETKRVTGKKTIGSAMEVVDTDIGIFSVKKCEYRAPKP